MKAGDKVKVSIKSLDWQYSDRETIFRFICEDKPFALVCPMEAVRLVHVSGLIPVQYCKECGQELPEGT